VDKAIAIEWLQWQKEIHIPQIMGTGLFHDYRFYELLEPDEFEGKTYVLQCFTNERNNYETYLLVFDPLLSRNAVQRWGDQFIGFRTLMKDA